MAGGKVIAANDGHDNDRHEKKYANAMHDTPQDNSRDTSEGMPRHIETPVNQGISPPSTRLTQIALLFEGGLALAALGLGWLFGVPVWSLVQFDLEGLLWGLFGSLPPIGALFLLPRLPLNRSRKLTRYVETHVAPLFRGCRLWQMAAIGVVAGLGEELLCRGFLQYGLQLRLDNYLGPEAATWAALALASVAFGAAHALIREYVAACVVMGFYLGGIMIASDNLLVPIIVHATYDFVALVYLTRESSGTRPAADT